MTASRIEDQAWVWLARVRKAQGRKGEVLADLLTDFPEKFKERKRVWLLSFGPGSVSPGGESPDPTGEATSLVGEAVPEIVREMALVDSFVHKGGIVLRFEGIDSIPLADGLRGMVVAIPRSQRVLLPEDEVYVGDLIGCSLVDVASKPAQEIGVIEDVDRDAGPVALLVVKSSQPIEEILVPFAKAYLHKIDLEAKCVEMALPEGLVEAQTN